MNERNSSQQMTLFSTGAPSWEALSQEAQRSILEALSQMLLQTCHSGSDGSMIVNANVTKEHYDE